MISKKIIIKVVLFICFTVSSFAQIEAGKAVIITVSGIPSEEKGRIDGTYPVSDSGFINMPFIGITPTNREERKKGTGKLGVRLHVKKRNNKKNQQ